MDSNPLDDIEIIPLGGAGAIPVNAGEMSPPLARLPNDDEEEDDDEVPELVEIPEDFMATKEGRTAIYKGQAMELYATYKGVLESKNWKLVSYSGAPGITCYEYPDLVVSGMNEGEKVYAFKAEGVVEWKKADEIARAHCDCNKVSRLSWDKDLSDIGLLEVVQEHPRMKLTVQYATHSPPKPVYAREFVYFQLSRKDPSPAYPKDNVWTLLCRHTEHPDRPITNDPVRAISMSVMLLEPLKPKADGITLVPQTNVVIMAWAQLGGWVPDSVVNLYKTKLADRIKFIRDTVFV